MTAKATTEVEQYQQFQFCTNRYDGHGYHRSQIITPNLSSLNEPVRRLRLTPEKGQLTVMK